MHSTIKTLAASGLAVLGLAAPALAASPERIVRFDAPLTPAAQQALVERAGGEVTRDLHLIDALGARLTDAQAARLQADPRVTVQDSAPVRTSSTLDPQALATAYNQSLKLDKVWASNTYGATGKGVTVAVIDTGIDGALPDFRTSQEDGTSRVKASVVVNPDATSAGDGYGHGTHVAGLIAGNGFNRAADDPLVGKYAGAAPDAELVSIKASDDQGRSSVIDVINGLQFAVDHRLDLGIRVVNLSLNSAVAQSYKTDPLDAAVEQAWNQGIVVVTASGNRGAAPDAVNYAPANDPFVLTVGGADDVGTKNIRDDALAAWSSKGRTQDGLRKPDIIAPGAHMVSTLAPGSAFASMCPACVTGNGEYLRIGGTSMSAGVASGVVAVMLQVHPDWTPDMVKSAIVGTARMVGGNGYQVDSDTAAKAFGSGANVKNVNAGLVPSALIDPSTGLIDYTKASWSKASWSDASDLLKASWSKASWSCAGCSTSATSVDTSKASWSKASWSFATTL